MSEGNKPGSVEFSGTKTHLARPTTTGGDSKMTLAMARWELLSEKVKAMTWVQKLILSC